MSNYKVVPENNWKMRGIVLSMDNNQVEMCFKKPASGRLLDAHDFPRSIFKFGTTNGHTHEYALDASPNATTVFLEKLRSLLPSGDLLGAGTAGDGGLLIADYLNGKLSKERVALCVDAEKSHAQIKIGNQVVVDFAIRPQEE